MHIESYQISEILRWFYNGQSLPEIQSKAKKEYDITPSISSLRRWVFKFSQIAIEKTEDLRPRLGDIWVVKETPMKAGGIGYNLTTVMCMETKYMISATLTSNYNLQSLKQIVVAASEKMAKTPWTIIIDGWGKYLHGTISVSADEIKANSISVIKLESENSFPEHKSKRIITRI
jgi:transposase-like protein